MSVTIIIKALNEADHIESAIRHALKAAEAVGGEVILADSGSTDGTTDIAKRFPITIVQLENWDERRCGIGPELGFRHAKMPFVAITDGDMEVDAGFIVEALEFLKKNADYAGVSGSIKEMSLDQLEYQRREQRKPPDMKSGDVDRLNGGGVFRREAIEQTGYLTDRNLHAYEEYDLALRLRLNGWKLHRLPSVFVVHYGHRVGAYKLLWRRLKSKYLMGVGELTRAHYNGPGFSTLLSDVREIRLWVGIIALWVAAIVGLLFVPDGLSGLAWLAILFLGPVPIMAAKYQSLAVGIYAVIAWHFHGYGFLLGFFAPRKDPRGEIAIKVLQQGEIMLPGLDAAS